MFILLATLLLLIPGRAPAFAEARYEEAAVRAAMLLNFPKFIAWPGTQAAPGKVCVVSAPPVLEALVTLQSTAEAAGRRLTLTAQEGIGEDCTYVYLGASHRTALTGLPPGCLVIREGRGERTGNGISAIELVRRGERVVIRVDYQRLLDDGFAVDARLLQLAEVFAGA